MEEYDRDAQELENNFRENQEKEKVEFEKELETSVQSKVRPTPKLLNMKYRIEQLSKYQRFEEAGKLQDQYNLEVGPTVAAARARRLVIPAPALFIRNEPFVILSTKSASRSRRKIRSIVEKKCLSSSSRDKKETIKTFDKRWNRLEMK